MDPKTLKSLKGILLTSVVFFFEEKELELDVEILVSMIKQTSPAMPVVFLQGITVPEGTKAYRVSDVKLISDDTLDFLAEYVSKIQIDKLSGPRLHAQPASQLAIFATAQGAALRGTQILSVACWSLQRYQTHLDICAGRSYVQISGDMPFHVPILYEVN